MGPNRFNHKIWTLKKLLFYLQFKSETRENFRMDRSIKQSGVDAFHPPIFPHTHLYRQTNLRLRLNRILLQIRWCEVTRHFRTQIKSFLSYYISHIYNLVSVLESARLIESFRNSISHIVKTRRYAKPCLLQKIIEFLLLESFSIIILANICILHT